MTMRLRNPNTGTVVTVGDESAKRLQAAGWGEVDAASASSSVTDEPADAESAPKSKRRSSTRRSE